jgi:hypothetical protein
LTISRGSCLALSRLSCDSCGGLGIVRTRIDTDTTPCECVDRECFRVCWNRFRTLVDQTGNRPRTINLTGMPRVARRISSRGNRNSDYLADFYLLAKRILTHEEWQVFSPAYLLGAEWKLVYYGRLGISRSHFWNYYLRPIQAKLGRAFWSTEPYALWPLDLYFSAGDHGHVVAPSHVKPAAQFQPLQAPLRKAA